MLRAAFALLTLTFALWMTPPAHAQTMSSSGGSMYYAGALAGVGFISDNGGTQIDLGLHGGYKLMPNISAGLYATYNPISSPANTSISLFTFTPEANYHFTDGPLSGARVGAKVGLGWVKTSIDVPAAGGGTTSESDSTLSLVFGPAVGYDYGLGGGLTIGGEANWLFYTSSGGFNAVNLLADLKYWF